MAAPALSASETFSALANDYIDTVYFPFNPTLATLQGVHTYDDQLEDYSKAGINKQIAVLKSYEKKVSALPEHALPENQQGDRALILNNIRGQLLTLQEIKPWEKNPDYYSSGITFSAFVIMERPFASENERLRLLIEREKYMPAVLQAARENLKNPPKIYTEVALEQLPGLIRFFQQDVPAAFAKADNAALKKAFTTQNNAVIQALIHYQTWLKESLLPVSKGDFRIGEKTFRKKLSYDEMVDIPLAQLLVIGERNLKKNQQELIRVAKEIDASKTPKELLMELEIQHPAPDKLLATFAGTFDDLIRFIKDKKIITLPSDIRPLMEESPPFMRAITTASMDTPGPFEANAKQAYFNVTLPDSNWDKQRIQEFMAQFSYPAISTIAVHEAYPGHYVQFLWMHTLQNRVRQLFGAASNAEGWAHYCEQMMLDEGYSASTELKTKQLRLGQLLDALLRNARFIVGIKMHTGQMSFAEGVAFFVKEAYQPHAVALMETKRGTMDPTYLYYTLGKLQILKLRHDLEIKDGPSFNLQTFHDNFMRQGYPPIAIVRKALLHDDSPTL